MQQSVIAYYAPLKPPDHPIPSGDRQMARMLMAALSRAEYDVFLASRYISYSKRYGLDHLENRKNGAKSEAERLLDKWANEGINPDLWFCYHPYDKSPDWLGMEICTALNIPMITAEPCKTGQGPNGEWAPWREEAQKGISLADCNIVMTHSDLEYLVTFVQPEKIEWMAPFIDAKLLLRSDQLSGAVEISKLWPTGRKLLAVGMMRPGAKIESYRMLAQSLANLQNEDWSLVIAGGGPGEEEVRHMFSWSGSSRVKFVGERSPEEVLLLMDNADVLTWPGCREAYGMVYLEAASFNCPAIALNNKGVPLVVEDQISGLLATPPDVYSYTQCLHKIINDDQLLVRLSRGAGNYARTERSGEKTAVRLREIIDPVLAGYGYSK